MSGGIMSRVFKVYQFRIPNKRDYRSLLRELEQAYTYDRLIFEVEGIDQM
jgi:hypothetical protein